MQRRVEQPDRDRQAVHRLEDADEVGLAAASRSSSSAASSSSASCRRGSCAARSAGGRRGTCARCGTGRCPRRRTRAPPARPRAGRRWCAPSAARKLVGPAEDRPERAGRLGRDHRRPRRRTTSPVVPLIEMTSPSCTVVAVDDELLRREVDLDALRRRRSRACPCRARRPPRGDTSPPRDVRMPSAAIMPCRSSGDVSGRTRITCSPRLVARLGVVGGEVHLADRRARRRVQALGEHGVRRPSGRTAGAAAGRAARAARAAPPRACR